MNVKPSTLLSLLLLWNVIAHSQAANNFPASGNVGIGTGTATPASPLTVVAAGSSSYLSIAELYAPDNYALGSASQMRFGQSGTSNNAAEWRFVYQGNGSGYNRTDFGYVGNASPVLSTLANGNIGVGTTSPLSRFHVKGTNVDIFGIYAVQDQSGSGATGQAFVTFLGNDNNRLAYFGPSYGYFVIQNDQSNKVAISPGATGKVFIGTPNFASDYGKMLQVFGSSYLQGDVAVGGNVGVGTIAPLTKLEAKGTIFSSSIAHDAGVYITAEAGGYGLLQATNNYNSTARDLVIQQYGGNVSIGTTNSHGYRLAVNGSAIFTQAKVQLYNNWPDYVFHHAYKLPLLSEVETFIKRYNHLPEVPSAKEVEEEGLDLGSNQATLLKKIEELTLYMIDLNKRVEEQKTTIQQQQKLLEGQTKLLNGCKRSKR